MIPHVLSNVNHHFIFQPILKLRRTRTSAALKLSFFASFTRLGNGFHTSMHLDIYSRLFVPALTTLIKCTSCQKHSSLRESVPRSTPVYLWSTTAVTQTQSDATSTRAPSWWLSITFPWARR